MAGEYRRKALVEIETWITHIDDMLHAELMRSPSARPTRDWRASVRLPNGHMLWEWHNRFEDAVTWCENWITK